MYPTIEDCRLYLPASPPSGAGRLYLRSWSPLHASNSLSALQIPAASSGIEVEDPGGLNPPLLHTLYISPASYSALGRIEPCTLGSQHPSPPPAFGLTSQLLAVQPSAVQLVDGSGSLLLYNCQILSLSCQDLVQFLSLMGGRL